MYKLKLLAVSLAVSITTACSTLASKDDTGVVIAQRAQIRSSTAVVAADLVEVSRGDIVYILGSQTAENGEQWYRVQATDEEETEGWLEARNVMLQKVLDQARALAQQDQDIPAQATGQLRAVTNLRLTPDRSGNENIMMKLDSGSHFEIVGWKRVPKPKALETTESDDMPKAGSAQRQSTRRRDKAPEEPNELWYRVRLTPAISPAPAGWIFGKQVELTVPSDIIFYRTGREFVAWHRLDEDGTSSLQEKDAAKEGKPGSWVILEKGSLSEPRAIDEPEFDRIYVLGYDKDRQEHYTAYRSPNVVGYLPLRVQGEGNSKTFSVRVKEDDQVREIQLKTYRDGRGFLRVTAPPEFSRPRRKR